MLDSISSETLRLSLTPTEYNIFLPICSFHSCYLFILTHARFYRFSLKRKIYPTPGYIETASNTAAAWTSQLDVAKQHRYLTGIYIVAVQPLHSFSGFSDMTVKTSENGCKSCISMLFTQQQIIIISQMVSACEWPAEWGGTLVQNTKNIVIAFVMWKTVSLFPSDFPTMWVHK